MRKHILSYYMLVYDILYLIVYLYICLYIPLTPPIYTHTPYTHIAGAREKQFRPQNRRNNHVYNKFRKTTRHSI